MSTDTKLLPCRPNAAIENLKNYQEQADPHGTTVTVSRQALDELLTYEEAIQAWNSRPAPDVAALDRVIRGLSGACHVDFGEIAADGGVTCGMVHQKDIRELYLPVLNRILTALQRTPDAGELRRAKFSGMSALANWEKYKLKDGDDYDEVAYQAQKVADACQAILTALQHTPEQGSECAARQTESEETADATDKAPCQSGNGPDCKSGVPGSIPGGVSTQPSADVVEALRSFTEQAESWLSTREPHAKPSWMAPAIEKAKAALAASPPFPDPKTLEACVDVVSDQFATTTSQEDFRIRALRALRDMEAGDE